MDKRVDSCWGLSLRLLLLKALTQPVSMQDKKVQDRSLTDQQQEDRRQERVGGVEPGPPRK